MTFRKKTDSNQLNRKRVIDVSDSRANKFTYHSVRSTRDSNTVRTGRDTKVELNDPHIVKKRWWRNLPAVLAVLVVFGSIIYAITLSTNPEVRVLGLSSQSIIQPTSVYQQAAQIILKNSKLNNTKITINTDKLATQFEKEFPELSGATVVIPLLGHNPIFEIRPSQSIFILTNAQGEFVVNQQGNAVLKLTGSDADRYNLPDVKDDSGLHVSLGQTILSSTSIVFIKTVVDQLAVKNIPIQSMTLATTPYELDVQVRGEPYYIKFNLLADPLYSVGTYFATVKLFTPSNPGPSQYIDVRIPGRAYYK